jgi:hypothetical protein
MAALFLSLALCADVTYCCHARGRQALQAYQRLRVKEVWAIQAETRRSLTPEERDDRDAPGAVLSEVHRALEDWMFGTCAAVAFALCALAWLVAQAPRAGWGGAALHYGLRGSVLGAVVCGTLLMVGRATAFWFSEPDRQRLSDRNDWEICWLIGATAGALGGAALGALGITLLGLLKRDGRRATTEAAS